jgi:hypothetical protein
MSMSSSQDKLERAVDAALDRIYMTTVNPIRKDAYAKMSKCFDLKTQSEIDYCVNKCAEPVEWAQSVISTEMNTFNDRLRRCSYSCQDEVQDYVGAFAVQTETIKNKAQVKMDACISNCVEKHIDVLGVAEAKMIAEIKKLSR